MKAKSMILIMIALGCGLVASIGVSQVMVKDGGAKKPELEMGKILVAMNALSIADPLTAENVKLEPWPKDRIPEGAITSLEDVEERFSKVRVIKGQPIVADMLMKDGGINLTIPDGFRVMSIKVSIENSLSGMLQPGDRVDISGFFRNSNKSIAKTFLHDVQVFAINKQTERIVIPEGKTTTAKTVSLLVTPGQVEKLLVASSSGKLHLSLRSHTDTLPVNTDGMSQDDILGGGSEQVSAPRVAPAPKPANEPNDLKDWLNRIQGAKDKALASAEPSIAGPSKVMVVYTPQGATEYIFHGDNQLPEIKTVGGSAPAPATVPPMTVPATKDPGPGTDPAAGGPSDKSDNNDDDEPQADDEPKVDA